MAARRKSPLWVRYSSEKGLVEVAICYTVTSLVGVMVLYQK